MQQALCKLDNCQLDGAEFLAAHPGAILADEVGLGKSGQAIRACDLIRANRILIVTEKSLICNWTDEVIGEIRRWSPGSSCARYTTQSYVVPDARFVITNYEAVVRKLEVLQDIPWSVVIIDEAQAFKNRRARRTKAVFALRRKIPHVWLITATPIMNRPEELWSLLHIIKPKQYSSYWRFINEHCNTIQNLWGGTEVIGIRDPAGLEQELAPLILRRNKKLLNLPPLTQETIYLEMSGEQKRIYKQLERDFIVRLDDEGEKFLSAPDILAQLIRLRQIACNPALVGGPDSSIKDAALLNLLDNLAGDYKVLVFTTFAGYVKHLWPKLQRYFPASIYGDMNIEDRWRNAATFQTDPACRVLLGTIGAMSKGLNLQAADVVILLDQDWVPASMEIQAIGRAHRRGQEKPVHAINLVCQGTVDEYIHQTILPKKREVIRAITQLMRGQKEGG